ncbi:hypothetical protein [Cellulomonas cellasea]|uniref:Uncharacterized protein n=1 Tax=Cellulomonas cellasea TaxID=43670 RepID=A0A7W4YC52_9CELL|nr:hypothetical protein [Cellulomonas cellasea]MBB2924655.1 hypothetical protein [Cellulomonas cellasea]
MAEVEEVGTVRTRDAHGVIHRGPRPAAPPGDRTSGGQGGRTAPLGASRPASADGQDEAEDDEVVEPAADETHEIDLRTIVVTMAITISVVTMAHLALLFMNVARGLQDPGEESAITAVPWQPLVAIALSVVSLTTFGGFYVAVRRARIALTASFLLTFLAMLPFALTIPELATVAETRFAADLLQQFSTVVGTVVVFYFGSEAVITGGKLFATAQKPEAAAEFRRADRDLATTTSAHV